jgi:peptidoglycan/xylan/chitin deacetylase (PgdA/CDA1 family)
MGKTPDLNRLFPMKLTAKKKKLVLHAFRAVGAFHAAKYLQRSRLRILTYHRFGKEHVSSQTFEKHVRFLKERFNLIDLESYLVCLRGEKELPPHSAILTIDDGYRDFYTVAFPILKKYSASATVFLTSDFVDKKIWLWHDLLNYGIKNTSRAYFTLNSNSFDLRDHGDRCELKSYLDRICTDCGPAERDIFINHILKELKVSIPAHPTSEYMPLSWTEVREMSNSGITFGSHTCTHPILSKLAPDEARREIKISKERMEQELQEDVPAFCYPNGKEDDFNQWIKEVVEDSGYACAMSMIYGMNDLKSDRYELRRIALDGRSAIHFLYDISGFGILRKSLRYI